MMENVLLETPMLNFSHPSIRALIRDRGWNLLGEKDRILAIYNYVRDEIAFGYNQSDHITAAAVLHDGYGQCNTKGTLFMALLRAVGIPCRLHGFLIDKIMQKGALKGFYYKQAPQEIVHSWVEVFFDGRWLNLEGFILDMQYLNQLQKRFVDCDGSFCGFGVATQDFKNPPIEWNENDTYIQKDKITKDLGAFDCPDALFSLYPQKIGWFKKFVFKTVVRHLMNRNIRRIRLSK